MIDTHAMAKLQEKYAMDYARTAQQRFRTSSDVQYAFAYFHFLIEGGAREGLDVARYFSLELDSDGDGVLNDNELRTLGAVVHKRSPTPAELDALRACLVTVGGSGGSVSSSGSGENQGHRSQETVLVESRTVPGGRQVDTLRSVFIRDITWDLIMGCPLVVDSLSRNARFGPTAQDMGAAEKEEVAFEMVGDDLNKTQEQLDAVRAKRPKFICLNDNMKLARPEVLRVLRDFLQSYYAAPCPMELPEGEVNPVLHIGPLRDLRRREGVMAAVWWAANALAAALLVAGAVGGVLASKRRGADAAPPSREGVHS